MHQSDMASPADRNMPILDGIGALKQSQSDPGARIVIASGESKEDILAAGSDKYNFAPKPFTPRSLWIL